MPWDVKNERSCFATPMPADPAPKKSILWSDKSLPEAADERRAALMKPDKMTDPVPWICVEINTGKKIG